MSDLGSQVYNHSMQKLITLWVIDFNDVIGFKPSGDGILYISSYRNNTDNIIFNEETYEYVGIYGNGFTSELNGQLPEPTLSIDRPSLMKLQEYKEMQSEYRQQTKEMYFDWRGAKVTRIRITDNYLGDITKGEYQYFVVNQVNRTTASTIEVGLAVSLAADRLNNETVQELAPNRCALKYRTWDEDEEKFIYTNEKAGGCPWGNPTSENNYSNVPDYGTRYYNDRDIELSDENKHLDSCSYAVSGCIARFDPDNEGLTMPFVGIYVDVANAQRTNK